MSKAHAIWTALGLTLTCLAAWLSLVFTGHEHAANDFGGWALIGCALCMYAAFTMDD